MNPKGPDAPNPAAENPGYKIPKLGTIDPLLWEGQPIPQRRWIVNGWVPQGNVTMISGDGAVGKSILAMQLLTCCATGNDWLGQETLRCRALGIFCEDDEDELHRRQANMNNHYGVGFADIENLQLCSRTRPMDENALMTFVRDSWRFEATEFYQMIHNAASEFGAQLVVLDKDGYGLTRNHDLVHKSILDATSGRKTRAPQNCGAILNFTPAQTAAGLFCVRR